MIERMKSIINDLFSVILKKNTMKTPEVVLNIPLGAQEIFLRRSY